MSHDIHDILDFLDDAMSDDRQAEFRAWLDEDASRWELLARTSFLNMSIGDAIRHEREADTTVKATAACLADSQDNATLLRELARLELAAKADPISLDALDESQLSPKQRPQDLAVRDVVCALGYLGLQTLRTRAAAYAAVAAVMVLALTVFLMSQPGSDDLHPIAQTPVPPASPALPDAPTRAVATVTTVHDAQWADAALADGDQLHVGQRLTLTQGYAEITTISGAIAILEAPCTVEMIDSPNAIRLHTGKLVGICETDSSKGFLVRTPHMDVTDLGTRFGVASYPADGTIVEVFQGQVAARPANQQAGDAGRVELNAGESLAVNTAGRVIPSDRFASDLFTTLRHGRAIAAMSEQVRWSQKDYAGLSASNWPRDEKVVVFEEFRRVTLSQDVPLTFSEPGSYKQFVGKHLGGKQSSVPSGQVISSYIVSYAPPSSGLASSQQQQATGEVRFSGEVIGITANPSHWEAFTQATEAAARGAAGIDITVSQLESDHTNSGGSVYSDEIQLSEDRRTVRFTFNTFSAPRVDAFRVIVREPTD